MRSLIAMCLLIMFSGCTLDDGENAPAQGTPGVKIVKVTSLGKLEQATFIRGRDGGYSAQVFNRSVWIFGDTILNADSDAWRNNSWLWTQDLDATDGIQNQVTPLDAENKPREFFPQTEQELAYNQTHSIDNPNCEQPCGARQMLWPGAIVSDPINERVLIFYSKYAGEPGEFNFSPIGSSIAKWTAFDEPVTRPLLGQENSEEPTLLFTGDVLFGEAALIRDGYLYAYGCEHSLEKPCYIARAALSDALERQAWQFWNGSHWSSEQSQSEQSQKKAIFNAHNIMSIHYSEYVEQYLLFYSKPLENEIYLRTAPSPQGPWSQAVFVANALPGFKSKVAYSALAHPEFALNQGEFEYLSYYRDTDELAGEIQLLEIQLMPNN